MKGNGDWHIFDGCGQRKTVTAEERTRFLAAATGLSAEKLAFCAVSVPGRFELACGEAMR